MQIQCERCGKVMKGRTELDTEILFTMHECEGMRKLSDLPLALLRRLAYGEITEAEAWELLGTEA